MEEIETTARKWGDSIAVIIPKKIVEKQKIKINDTIRLLVKRNNNASGLFGSLKNWDINPQKTKDDLRKEWNK